METPEVEADESPDSVMAASGPYTDFRHLVPKTATFLYDSSHRAYHRTPDHHLPPLPEEALAHDAREDGSGHLSLCPAVAE